jgi:uncharacterized protein YcfL
MHGKYMRAIAAGAFVTLALVSGCSASKKTPATTGGGALATASATSSATASAKVAAATATTAPAAATPSASIAAAYLAAIAPVDKLRDEYEASKGKPSRATIGPAFAASLRAFDAVAARLPATGRTEADLQKMVSDDQAVATEVTANNLTVPTVDRDDAAHAVVRADLGLPPA